jgi:TRAP-type mannitol/chloroaromatic compound transport system substrate-binding protein
MARSFAIAIIAFFAGLCIGLGYLAVQRATPIPERVVVPQNPVLRDDMQPISLRLASSYTSAAPQLGSIGAATTTKLARLSGGLLDLKFHEPGALVPAAEVFDAVASGEVDAGWTSAAYLLEKDSAFGFFVGLPFGPRTSEYLGWLYHGGGQELMAELFGRYDVVPMVCGVLVAEGGGWFRKEINSSNDLRGMKIRFPGLGGEVLRKLGAETNSIAGGEVYNAFATGQIDGSEFSTPINDLRFGFYKVAPHYYLPGWHQPFTAILMVFHRQAWEKLSESQQAMVETVCGDNVSDSLAEGEAQQPYALNELRAKGAIIHTWPPEVLQAFERSWRKVVAEQSAANPNFKRIWESYSAFREASKEWRQINYMK